MRDSGWIDRSEYPFEARYLDVPAGRLHYVDEGTGSPIVMVHGNPTWSFLYRDLIRRLASGYRCVAMDHIGFGLSDKPRAWSYLPADHARNLCALIDALALDDITLVLHDWGGPIGLHFAVTHPERVARLVLMNTWAWPVDRDLRFLAFAGLMGGPVGGMLIRRYNFFARVLLRQAFADKSRLGTAVHRHYLRPLTAPEDRRGCIVLPGQLTASTAWLADIWAGIDSLRGRPKLYVWGMKDPAFREKTLRRWERAFPEASTVRLEGVGHLVQEEAPDAVARAVVPFLAETGGA